MELGNGKKLKINIENIEVLMTSEKKVKQGIFGRTFVKRDKDHTIFLYKDYTSSPSSLLYLPIDAHHLFSS